VPGEVDTLSRRGAGERFGDVRTRRECPITRTSEQYRSDRVHPIESIDSSLKRFKQRDRDCVEPCWAVELDVCDVIV